MQDLEKKEQEIIRENYSSIVAYFRQPHNGAFKIGIYIVLADTEQLETEFDILLKECLTGQGDERPIKLYVFSNVADFGYFVLTIRDKQITTIEEQKKQCQAILDQECMHIITDTLRQQAVLRENGAYRFEFEEGWFSADADRNFFFPYKIIEADLPLHTNFIFGEEKARFQSFHHSLEAAYRGISMTPIMAESGKYEEKPLAPRTYADVHNEIANSLVGLPNFTARVKIASTNGTLEQPIKTLQPEKGLYGNSLQERIDRIRASNIQQSYLRDRTKVEAEIIKRQTSCSSNGSTLAQPQQSQQPSPQTPRHARTVPVQGNCPKCGFSKNPSEARFCMQCGAKLQ